MQEQCARQPDAVIACVGGGSNAMGIFLPYIPVEGGRLIGVEADGPSIQCASERALRKGVSLRQVLEMVVNFRADNNDTPVVLMGYANPIETMGGDMFSAAAFDAGVDGVLVVDYPPEESIDFARAMTANAPDPIFLLALTSTAARIALVPELASGYVYYVSLKGVTGSASLDVAAVALRIPEIHAATGVPVGVCFGIRDAQTVGSVAWIADAVVVAAGSSKRLNNRPTKMYASVFLHWSLNYVAELTTQPTNNCYLLEDSHELVKKRIAT